jgi:hypothetical protein
MNLKVDLAMNFGISLLLALAPTWSTPLLFALALLPRGQTLGPLGILAGTLVGTALANPLGTSGYQVGEAFGFPFLGMWAALALAVLAAQVTATLARVATLTLKK